jgi:hypothetical protein
MTYQKQQENVDYFSYLSSILKMMQNLHVKLNLGLPRQREYQKEEKYFTSKSKLN